MRIGVLTPRVSRKCTNHTYTAAPGSKMAVKNNVSKNTSRGIWSRIHASSARELVPVKGSETMDPAAAAIGSSQSRLSAVNNVIALHPCLG
jgi:hypothetical protein